GWGRRHATERAARIGPFQHGQIGEIFQPKIAEEPFGRGVENRPAQSLLAADIPDQVTFQQPLDDVVAAHAPHRLDLRAGDWLPVDRKSTRLNSSHGSISYAVF